jgi:hypothetical protein
MYFCYFALGLYTSQKKTQVGQGSQKLVTLFSTPYSREFYIFMYGNEPRNVATLSLAV